MLKALTREIVYNVVIGKFGDILSRCWFIYLFFFSFQSFAREVSEMEANGIHSTMT